MSQLSHMSHVWKCMSHLSQRSHLEMCTQQEGNRIQCSWWLWLTHACLSMSNCPKGVQYRGRWSTDETQRQKGNMSESFPVPEKRWSADNAFLHFREASIHFGSFHSFSRIFHSFAKSVPNSHSWCSTLGSVQVLHLTETMRCCNHGAFPVTPDVKKASVSAQHHIAGNCVLFLFWDASSSFWQAHFLSGKSLPKSPSLVC